MDDLVADVVDSDADGRRAVAGDRRRGVGEDLYLAHPATGVFQLKTYAKNPFEVRGVGAQGPGRSTTRSGRGSDNDAGGSRSSSFAMLSDGGSNRAVQRA